MKSDANKVKNKSQTYNNSTSNIYSNTTTNNQTIQTDLPSVTYNLESPDKLVLVRYGFDYIDIHGKQDFKTIEEQQRVTKLTVYHGQVRVKTDANKVYKVTESDIDTSRTMEEVDNDIDIGGLKLVIYKIIHPQQVASAISQLRAEFFSRLYYHN